MLIISLAVAAAAFNAVAAAVAAAMLLLLLLLLCFLSSPRVPHRFFNGTNPSPVFALLWRFVVWCCYYSTRVLLRYRRGSCWDRAMRRMTKTD